MKANLWNQTLFLISSLNLSLYNGCEYIYIHILCIHNYCIMHDQFSPALDLQHVKHYKFPANFPFHTLFGFRENEGKIWTHREKIQTRKITEERAFFLIERNALSPFQNSFLYPPSTVRWRDFDRPLWIQRLSSLLTRTIISIPLNPLYKCDGI